MRPIKAGAALSGSFADLVREVPVPEKYLGNLRAKQVDTVAKMAIIIVCANLLSLAVIILAISRTGMDRHSAFWALGVLFFCGVSVLRAMRHRRTTPANNAETSHLDGIARNASINGLLWALLPLIAHGSVDQTGFTLIAITLSGIMFAGAFLFSRLPDAALAFVVPVGIGLILALQLQQQHGQQGLVSMIVLLYVCLLMLAIRWSHRQFVEQYMSEAAMHEQSQLISLLLRDFEESTSDLIWQTNDAGILTDLPLTIGRQIEDNAFLARGRSIVDLFEESESRQVLETSLVRKRSFQDIALLEAGSDVARWWSLTGKPILEDGVFKGFRGVATDITESKEIEHRIAYMAHFDGLTGLPNRAQLQERVERKLREPYSGDVERVLIWLDLDNFKWVNDTLGHQAGDELLRLVANRINSICLPEDFVARLSGDEFAMIVERPSGRAVEPFLDKLSALLREPYEIWGSTVVCSASIGVRHFDPHTVDSRTLFKHADLALYQAKSLGKATWCQFSPELDERARARLQIESELRRALDQNELKVYFQPLVDSVTHEIVSVETLLRWVHPKRGLIMPADFIEHAEDIGLITRIGDWVIRAALREATRLPENVRISVNISPLQVHSATLVSTIVSAIAINQIAPSRLELEITESVLMSDTDFTLKRLHHLKELGVRIALDDFGTGYSSLSYLRAFPFDKIKIDKGFVKDIETREDCRAITIATLNLAKSLGMRSTAEGVETLFQADFLRDHGCDELQGFFISRAQPLGHLGHLIPLNDQDDAGAGTRPKPSEPVLIAIPGGAAKQAR